MRHFLHDMHRSAAVVVFCLILACGLSSSADARVIDSYNLQPAPDGTNIIETYGTFDRYSGFRFSNGQTMPNTHLDEASATVRYRQYIYIDGHPAGLQISQSVDYFADWQFDGFKQNNASGLRQLGVGGTTLSAFFWPYSSTVNQTQVYTAVFLTPPAAGYDKNRSFSPGYGGWQGDAQAGIVKGFGPHLSLEAAFDGDFHGSESIGFDNRRNTDPIWRLQLWANWDWHNGLRTSVGYIGTIGGQQSNSFDGTQFSVPRNADKQTLRAAVSY